jgi:LCP family protein required for cell wall assembly
MRVLCQRLLLAMVGLLTLGGLTWHLLSSRPFAPAPSLSRPPRPKGRLAPSFNPSGSTLPRDLFAIRKAATPPLTETVNLLLAGVDTRADVPGSGGRTDALVLVVMHRGSGHVGLVGIPRDLLVDLPGHGPVRINTVYQYGARQGGGERGAALLKKMVRHVLGLTVHHTVFVDHAGFERVVDSLGGVAVRVTCPIRDRFIDSRGVDGRLELDLDPGVHWMDGRTALMFARCRHGRGIVDRARRQQAVLLGLRDRLAQLGASRVVELLPPLTRTLYTDMRSMDMLRLVRFGLGVRRDQIHGLVLDWRHTETRVMADGRWVMLPKPEAIHAALTRLFEVGTPGYRRAETCPPKEAGLRSIKTRKPTGRGRSPAASSRAESSGAEADRR